MIVQIDFFYNFMIFSAKKLIESGARNVLIKGGHLNSKIVQDVLLTKDYLKIFTNVFKEYT